MQATARTSPSRPTRSWDSISARAARDGRSGVGAATPTKRDAAPTRAAAPARRGAKTCRRPGSTVTPLRAIPRALAQHGQLRVAPVDQLVVAEQGPVGFVSPLQLRILRADFAQRFGVGIEQDRKSVPHSES